MVTMESVGSVVGNSRSGSTGERFTKAGVEIERSPWAYKLLTAAEYGGTYTRLHNVLELIKEPKIYMSGLKGQHVSRVHELGIVATPFELDAAIPLEKRTVSWPDAVTAIGAGMVVNDLLQRVAERDGALRQDLNAVLNGVLNECKAQGIAADNPLIGAIKEMVSRMASATPLEVVRQVGMDMGAVEQGVARQEAITPIVKAVMEHASYVDASYMQRSADNGTVIHALLEFAGNWAMDNRSVEWPEAEINRVYVGVIDDLKDKARVTWDSAIETLGITPESLFDVELVILINHDGERIAGAVDMAFIRNDELVILDWKTGKTVDKAEYQAQLVSYSMASTLLTRHGIFEIDNPEARRVRETGVLLEDLPTTAPATFQWGDRKIKMADYGILARTAVDPTQDESDQSPQFWRVNYDPLLREFAYRMVQMHSEMRDREIDKRLRRGIVRIRGIDDAPRRKAQVQAAPTVQTSQAPTPAQAERAPEIQQAPPAPQAQAPEPQAPEPQAQLAKTQAPTSQAPENKSVATPAPVASPKLNRLVETYGTRFGWTDDDKQRFIAFYLANQEGVSTVGAVAAKWNDEYRNEVGQTQSMSVG